MDGPDSQLSGKKKKGCEMGLLYRCQLKVVPGQSLVVFSLALLIDAKAQYWSMSPAHEGSDLSGSISQGLVGHSSSQLGFVCLS